MVEHEPTKIMSSHFVVSTEEYVYILAEKDEYLKTDLSEIRVHAEGPQRLLRLFPLVRQYVQELLRQCLLAQSLLCRLVRS